MDKKIKSLVKSRICILNASFYPMIGGGESHSKLLAENLISRGGQVFVLTRRSKKELKFSEMVGEIPVIRVPPSGFKRWGKYLWLFPASIRLFQMRNHYDIIYVCGLRIAGIFGVITGKILKKKSILRSESCGELSGDFIWNYSNFRKKSTPGILIQILILSRNFILKNASCFLGISKAICDEYLSCAVDPKKIVKIPNGIDTSKFQPVDQNEKKNLRQKLKLPSNLIFSYSGKLNKGKGLELLLRVWKSIILKRHDAHLLLVGSGDHQFLSCEHELKSYVKENQMQNNVTFTGFVENVQDYLKASDFFVFPSENEALGLSLLEALSCELPVITTKTGGILDIIDNEKNGLLVNVGDEDGLFKRIEEIISDSEKAKALGKKGRETVMKKFGINYVIDKHFKLFSSL
jgi:glycosyltransferase involved in cell wall biosynthesis